MEQSVIDPKTQLCRYAFEQHQNGLKPLTPWQIGTPWTWIYKTEPVMNEGETVTNFTVLGVKIPSDGEHAGYTFLLNEIT